MSTKEEEEEGETGHERNKHVEGVLLLGAQSCAVGVYCFRFHRINSRLQVFK